MTKEDWENVHEALEKLFPYSEQKSAFMAESPVAYTRYGDRNIFKDKVHTEHTNKGYRSQHYVVKFEKYYCEIQVRTLAEEVYGEFDHKIKYPYRDDNRFLRRYTNTLSQLLASVDALISTCFQMDVNGWEQNDSYYIEDEDIDWRKTSQLLSNKKQQKNNLENTAQKIDIKTYANNIILRKD